MEDKYCNLNLTEFMEVPNEFKPFIRKINKLFCSIVIKQYQAFYSLSQNIQYDLIVTLPYPKVKADVIGLLEIMKDAARCCNGEPTLSFENDKEGYHRMFLILKNVESKQAKILINHKAISNI